jgi:lysophospholipase L1-like esterase
MPRSFSLGGTMTHIFGALLATVVFAFNVSAASAQDAVLQDRNGDGSIEVIAFGDSITYGVGDGYSPDEYVEVITDFGKPRGYPRRLSSLLGVSVLNAGVPGEGLAEDGSETGVERFPGVVLGSDADVVIIAEGTNDAERLVPNDVFVPALQKMVNVARAAGRQVVLSTLATPIGLRAQYAPFTQNISNLIRDVAAINSLPLVDIEKLFQDGCPVYEDCQYYNRPEGLHPNTVGYDAIAAGMASVLQGG